MMKMKYFFGLSLLLFIGCKKQLNINQDPNNPSIGQATPQLLFPVGTMSTAGRVGGELAILGGIWSEYFTQAAFSSQYRQIDAYNLQNTDLNGNYTELFAGASNDMQTVIAKAEQTQDWNFYLMGTVMQAYTMQVLVDLYDQVPYSEAFMGATNLQPKFDDGYSIYENLLSKLDTALSKDFSASTNQVPGTSDIVFGGDMDKWIRFANTLKLKMYLRMINAKPDEAKQGITALYNSGAAFLESDAAITGFSETPDKQNPMYAYNIYRLNTTTNIRASVTFVSWLEANSDPRIEYYFGTTTPIAMHQGDYLGSDPTYQNATVFVQRPDDPVEFISAAESYFMQAEARERYFSGDGAKDLYNAGVSASFSQMGYDASSFIGAGGVYEYPEGSLESKVEAIIVQKWVSCAYGCHGLEAFFERNRTGYPESSPVYSTSSSYVPGEFVVSATSVLGQKYPKRLVFPDVERSRNKNTPEEVSITTPVWWAK